MSSTLYERLGGSERIARIAADIVDLHGANPRIACRFAQSDTSALKQTVADFFIAGSGGPDNYKGKDMRAAHAGMNIDAEEFLTVLDDVLEALSKNGVDQAEAQEVLAILYSMKPDVMRL